jgi:PKD repeat protein
VNVVDASAPAPPVNLQSTVSGAEVTLTWQPSPTASATGYVVQQRSGGSTAATDIPVGDTLTYTVTNLDTRKGYTFTAVAHDAEGRRSGPGNAVTVSWTRCTIAAVTRVPSVVTRGDVNEFAVETQMQGGCGQSPTFVWTFGDGTTGSSAEFSHTYAQSGTYPWSVVVTSGDATSTVAGTIRVEESRCTIRVDRPSGGTALEPGRVTLVAWSMDGPCSGDVRLDVIRDGVFVETVEPSTHGTFTSWTPPGRLGGAKYYLRISDVANPAYAGLSQEFTISDPPKRRATRH